MIISRHGPQPLSKGCRDLATSLWQTRNRWCQPPNRRHTRHGAGQGGEPGGGDAPQSHAGRSQAPRQTRPAQDPKGGRAGVALCWENWGKKHAIHPKPPGPRRATLPAMRGHAEYKAPWRSPACQQKRQQARAFPPIRQMQPGPQCQRRPAIPGKQQPQPALARQPRHWRQKPRRQAARHHPGATRQARHGQARVRQAGRVTE